MLRRLNVLLPSYNEEHSLPELLHRFDALGTRLAPDTELQVVVADDGSTDQTAAAASAHPGLPVLLIRHDRNEGLGATLRSGVNWFLRQCEANPDVEMLLAVLDADCTHPPELLATMLARMNDPETPVDVVIASRYAPGGAEHGLSSLRRLLSRAASLGLRICLPVRGSLDYTCGFRLYRGSMLRRAAQRYGPNLVRENGFVCMAELLVKLARSGARVAEVPLELHYELKGGPSKLRIGATIWRYAVFTARTLLTR